MIKNGACSNHEYDVEAHYLCLVSQRALLAKYEERSTYNRAHSRDTMVLDVTVCIAMFASLREARSGFGYMLDCVWAVSRTT